MALDMVYSSGLSMQTDASRYAQGNRPQQTFHRYVTTLQPIPWQPGDVVLDVGCGTGEVSHIMLDGNESIQSMIGIDINANAVEYAEDTKHDSRISFQVGSATGDWPAEWKQHFSKVVSFAALHYVKDQATFLRKAFDALQPGGSVYFTFLFNSGFLNDTLLSVRGEERWKPFFPDTVVAALSSKNDWAQPDAYLRLLQEAGFSVLHVSLVPFMYDYEDEEALRRYFRGVNMYSRNIPAELHDEFERDFVVHLSRIFAARFGHPLRRQVVKIVAQAVRPSAYLQCVVT